MANAFDAPALSRGPDKTELRGLAPSDLVRALDLMALAKGLDRNAYIVDVLEKHVAAYLEEISVVACGMRGNPLMPERLRSAAP